MKTTRPRTGLGAVSDSFINTVSEFSTITPRTKWLQKGEIMGYYQCIRCGGGDVYTSEENGRTFAVTLNTPSPVDPTLFHTMKQTVTRCKACGEKSNYILSKEEQEYENARAAKIVQRIFPASIILGGVMAFYIWANSGNWDPIYVMASFLLGIALTTVGAIRLSLTFRMLYTVRIRLLMGSWSIIFFSLFGFSFVPWGNYWGGPILQGLSILTLSYLTFLILVTPQGNGGWSYKKLIQSVSVQPVSFALLSGLYWTNEWVGVFFLITALVSLAVLSYFYSKGKRAPVKQDS